MISDWIVTFLLIIRGGGPSSGYVSTGFFGGEYLQVTSLFSCDERIFLYLGLTLGRVILVEVTKKVNNILYQYHSNDSRRI